jgi:hypothetical protein
MFLSACFLFHILRTRRDPTNLVFATALTLAVVFLVQGWPGEIIGPLVTPGVGPFRFVWPYAILAVLLWDHRTGAKARRVTLWLGNLAWLLGTLWSCESAAYSAATWLPAYTLIVWPRAATAETLPRRALLLVTWLLIPPALLAGAIGAIHAYYVRHIGHGPDWTAFVEYVLVFRHSLPIDTDGPVWLLVLLLCALSMLALPHVRRGLTDPSVPLLCGAWGLAWATASYFVARGAEINARNLAPLFCTSIGVALSLPTRGRNGDGYDALARTSLVPALVVFLTLAFGNRAGLADYTSPLHSGYTSHPEDLLPRIDSSLAGLLDEAGIKRSDPIVFYDTNLLPVWPVADGKPTNGLEATHAWLPTHPFALMMHMPPDRAQLYLSRFMARDRAGGWLIEPKDVDIREALGGGQWFYHELERTHARTVSFDNARWRVTWFAPTAP